MSIKRLNKERRPLVTIILLNQNFVTFLGTTSTGCEEWLYIQRLTMVGLQQNRPNEQIVRKTRFSLFRISYRNYA